MVYFDFFGLEVGVLPVDFGVFFVYVDCVWDCYWFVVLVVDDVVEVVDFFEVVAVECEWVGELVDIVLVYVEHVLEVVRWCWVVVGDEYFG